MNVSCPECHSVFRVDPRKVPASGIRARCSVCGGVIAIGVASIDEEFAPPPQNSQHAASSSGEPPMAAAAPRASAEAPPAAVLAPMAAPAAERERAAAAPEFIAPPIRPPAGARSPLVTPPGPPPAPLMPAAPPALTPPRSLAATVGPMHLGAFAPRPASEKARSEAAGAAIPPTPPTPARPVATAANRPPIMPPGPRLWPPTPAFSMPVAARPRPQTPPDAAAPSAPPRPTPVRTPVRTPINPFLANDPNARARRLARALISDLATYFPQRREEGLREGTLKQLFREEIRKSYDEYVEQVGHEFAESTMHFQDALNDVLAGGEKIF